MKYVNLPKLRCKRCGHEWIPRKEEKPTICPKCKSPYWDKERIRERKGELPLNLLGGSSLMQREDNTRGLKTPKCTQK